jgi:hypothetical protein
MNTKLTLQLDEKLIANAKRYSDQSGKSVSQLVADYFALIGTSPDEAIQLTPRVRSLIGTVERRQDHESRSSAPS